MLHILPKMLKDLFCFLFLIKTEIECAEADVGSNVVKAGCRAPYTYGSQCVYMCLPGYVRTRGSTERECQQDSTWNGEPLECESKY